MLIGVNTAAMTLASLLTLPSIFVDAGQPLPVFPPPITTRQPTCVIKFSGMIIADNILGWTIDMNLTDNGVKVCHGQSHQDDRKDWHFKCDDGYDLILSEKGNHVTYTKKGNTIEWNQVAKMEWEDGYGACQDKRDPEPRKGFCTKILTYSWDTKRDC